MKATTTRRLENHEAYKVEAEKLTKLQGRERRSTRHVGAAKQLTLVSQLLLSRMHPPGQRRSRY